MTTDTIYGNCKDEISLSKGGRNEVKAVSTFIHDDIINIHQLINKKIGDIENLDQRERRNSSVDSSHAPLFFMEERNSDDERRSNCTNDKEKETSSNHGIKRSKAISDQPVAVKFINKQNFWAKVKDGKDRSDAIVREVLAQVLLSSHFLSPSSLTMLNEKTSKGSLLSPRIVPDLPIVQIYNVFESLDNFVMELELMEVIFYLQTNY